MISLIKPTVLTKWQQLKLVHTERNTALNINRRNRISIPSLCGLLYNISSRTNLSTSLLGFIQQSNYQYKLWWENKIALVLHSKYNMSIWSMKCIPVPYYRLCNPPHRSPVLYRLALVSPIPLWLKYMSALIPLLRIPRNFVGAVGKDIFKCLLLGCPWPG